MITRWRIDPLLRSNHEQRSLLSNARDNIMVFSVVHDAAVSDQQPGKHVPAATEWTQQQKSGIFYEIRAEKI
jgi:hypothetical protein